MYKDNHNKMRRLTTWEAIGSKPVAFLLITVALFIVQIQVVYQMLVVLLAVVASSFVTTMLENSAIKMVFQFSVTIIMALISVALAIWLTKLFSKRVPAIFSSEEEEKAHFINIGKWKKIYASILGFFVFAVSLMITILIDMLMRDSGSGSYVVALLGSVLSIVFGVLFAKFFNRHMMKVTRTNFYLLEEVWAGVHNTEIPDDYYNDKGFNKIIKILRNGEAHTVGGAVAVLIRRERIMRIAVIGGALAAVLGWTAGNALGNSINRQINDSVRGGLAGGNDAGKLIGAGAGIGGAAEAKKQREAKMVSDRKQREANTAEYKRKKSEYDYRLDHGHNAKTYDHHSQVHDKAYEDAKRSQRGGR